MNMQLISSENVASEMSIWGQYIKYFMRECKLVKKKFTEQFWCSLRVAGCFSILSTFLLQNFLSPSCMA